MGKPSQELGYGSAAVPDSATRNPFRRMKNAVTGKDAQGIGTDEHVAPTGPPPSDSRYKADFQPPPGSPPNHRSESFAPPAGPPPKRAHQHDPAGEQEPPPYDPWLSIPDNSSLPPPPSLQYEASPTANASPDHAASARTFTRQNPLYAPRRLRSGELSEISSGHLSLTKPPSLRTCTLRSTKPGTWHLTTALKTDDSILLTSLPLYAAAHHNPVVTGRPYTAYFELRVIKLDQISTSAGEVSAAVAIGFVAPPYPPWRLPGWERASVGVHGDDGRRYVNDNLGGRDFTTSFSEGEVVGVGMKFAPGRGRNAVEVFFTREGRRVGGWDLWEERDAEDGEVGDPVGLGGDRDLVGAVGLFGAVEVEWKGRRDEWLYRPKMN